MKGSLGSGPASVGFGPNSGERGFWGGAGEKGKGEKGRFSSHRRAMERGESGPVEGERTKDEG